jgi:hypothetical protein
VRFQRSRNVRYASNTDRIDASQQNVAMCQLRLNAPQQTALSARSTNPAAISWCDRWNELSGEK